jgi:hypothetical protein
MWADLVSSPYVLIDQYCLEERMSKAYELGLKAGRVHGMSLGIRIVIYDNPYSILYNEHYEWADGFSDGWAGK